MADYLTQAILEARYGTQRVKEFLDDDGDGVVDTTRLDAVIADSEADVNACLNKGYVIPINVTDHGQRAYDAVVSLCARAAEYHMAVRRGQVPDSVRDRYDTTLRLALEMAKGVRALPGEPPVPRTSPESSQASHRLLATTDPKPVNRVWSRDDTGNM